MPNKTTSQVVLVRRRIDAVIDDIANEIAMRRKRRTRTFITAFGNILSTLDEILSDLESLQYRGHKEIPSALRMKIIEAEKVFAAAQRKIDFEEIISLL